MVLHSAWNYRLLIVVLLLLSHLVRCQNQFGLVSLVINFFCLFMHYRWTEYYTWLRFIQATRTLILKRWMLEVCHPHAIIHRANPIFTKWEFPQSKSSSRSSWTPWKKHSFRMILYGPSSINPSHGSSSLACRPFSPYLNGGEITIYPSLGGI